MKNLIIAVSVILAACLAGCAATHGSPVEVSNDQQKKHSKTPRHYSYNARNERNQSIAVDRTPGGRVQVTARGKVAGAVPGTVLDPEADYSQGVPQECLELAKAHPEATVIFDGETGSCSFIVKGSGYTPPPRIALVIYKNMRSEWVKVILRSGQSVVMELYLDPGKSAKRQIPEGDYDETIVTASDQQQTSKRKIFKKPGGLEVDIG